MLIRRRMRRSSDQVDNTTAAVIFFSVSALIANADDNGERYAAIAEKLA
jgi:hypothetical protein